jgi:zinc transporter ZupT
MIGTYIGLIFQRNEAFESILLAMTSGGFIYIATTSMIPTILSSKQSSPKQIMWEFNSFLLGLGFMAAVLLLEDEH